MAKPHLFSSADVKRLRRLHLRQMPHHLREAYEARHELRRILLKDRQLGLTWHMARDAVMVALETGRDQFVISTSEGMARIYRDYAVQFIKDGTGVLLSGQELQLHFDDGKAPATIRYSSYGSRGASADIDGDRYYDEFLWTPGYIPPDDGVRTTYISSPIPSPHPGYKAWFGKWEDVSWETVRYGARGVDGVWRQVVALEDAVSQGFTDADEAIRLKLKQAAPEIVSVSFPPPTSSGSV